MPDYSWVAQKKVEAMRRKLQKRGMPDYRQLPVSQRYGVGFTGYGDDGKLNPEEPAGMELAGRQHIYHEGEIKADLPEGSMYLDANTTARAYPEMGSFQSGGASIEGAITGTGITQYDPERQPRRRTSAVPAVGTAAKIADGVVRAASRPAGTTVEAMQTQPTQSPDATVNPVRAPTRPELKPFTMVTPENTADRTGGNIGVVGGEAFNPENYKNYRPAGTVSEVDDLSKEMDKYYDEQDENKPAESNIGAVGGPAFDPKNYTNYRPAGTAVTEEKPTTGTTAVKTQEDIARETAMKYQTDTLNKENPALMLEGRRQMDELSARQQQERSALEQRLLQEGVDPGRARLESQLLRDKQETERNDLGAQYGIAGMQARDTAAANLASQGLAGQQFEQDKKQYGDSQGWTAYEAAIAAGDFTTAASSYKAVTGKDISMDQMKTYQNYLNTKNQQDITSGQITIDSMKNKLSDEGYSSVQNMINSGSSLATVNARLKEQGKPEISGAEFTSMLEATPLGERNWGRNLSAANMLLTNMNFDQAAEAYAEIFPGVTFDFTNLKNEKKGEDFASGMSELASYVTANMDVGSAISAMQSSGALTKMGIDPTRATEYFNAMKVNAVDAEWEDMENSDFYKDLSTEEQTDQREFFKQKMLGQLDYTTLHEYEIYNPDGTLNMTVHGKDSTEADKKAASLGSGYTVKDTGKVKFQMASTIVSGTTGTGTTPTPSKTGEGTTKPVGEKYVEGGRVYNVGAGGTIEEIVVDPAVDMWSKNADTILTMPKEGNPYYDDILSARAKSILDLSHSVENRIEDTSTYEKTLEMSKVWDFNPVEKFDASGEIISIQIGSLPAVDSIVSYNGTLYKVKSGQKLKKAAVGDPDHGNYIDVVDLKDGRSAKIFVNSKLTEKGTEQMNSGAKVANYDHELITKVSYN
ncbi:MAG: hypothetical protein WC449_05875 [Candidatus Paceibacterota bacterium]